jgi:hypothetical protein
MQTDPAAPPADAAIERLAAIEARANAATEGPWLVWDGTRESPPFCAIIFKEQGQRWIAEMATLPRDSRPAEDARFIARSREDIPWLLDRLRALAAGHAALLAAAEAALDLPVLTLLARTWDMPGQERKADAAAVQVRAITAQLTAAIETARGAG